MMEPITAEKEEKRDSLLIKNPRSTIKQIIRSHFFRREPRQIGLYRHEKRLIQEKQPPLTTYRCLLVFPKERNQYKALLSDSKNTDLYSLLFLAHALSLADLK